MDNLEGQRAVELVKQLHGVRGVVSYPSGELSIVSYPETTIGGSLRGFTNRDLECAVELKLLKKADKMKIDGKEYDVYMKTNNAANKD